MSMAQSDEADSEADSEVSFAQIQRVVTGHFRSLDNYQPGGIISRSQVAGALEQLEDLGWCPGDRAAILDQVLSDDDWLVLQLRSPAGRRFTAHIAGLRQGFDRLDRLTRLPQGKQTVLDLIHGPGGHKLIEYLVRSPGGIEIGKMLSKAPRGANFNKPTGRIYTLDALLARLRSSHHKAH